MFLPDLWGSLAVLGFQYEDSLLYRLLTYLKERYFTVEFHIYEHIPLGADSNEEAALLIIGLALGLILATVFMTYTRMTLGRFIRDIVRADCLSAENAKTLSELGHFRNAAVRRELARGINLRRYVRRIEEQEGAVATAEKGNTARKNPLAAVKKFFFGDEERTRVDFLTARFYIPRDLRDAAELRFASRRYEWLVAALAIIGIAVVAALLCRTLPDIVQLMDNIIKMMAP